MRLSTILWQISVKVSVDVLYFLDGDFPDSVHGFCHINLKPFFVAVIGDGFQHAAVIGNQPDLIAFSGQAFALFQLHKGDGAHIAQAV